MPDFDAPRAVRLVKECDSLSGYIDKIIAELDEMVRGANSLEGLAEAYILFKNCAEIVHSGTKKINIAKDKVSYDVVPEKFLEEGVKTITTLSGHRVTVSNQLSVKILEKEAGYQWLKDNGLEALIKPTVNASSLKAAIKDMMENENKQPPTDVFSVKNAAFTSVTSTKK